jgi:hypothetical protein
MSLYVREEVFKFGVLPHDLLSMKAMPIRTIIAKFAEDAKAQTTDESITNLKFSTWRTTSQALFGCSEKAARVYFETFLAVHSKNAASQESRPKAPKLVLSVNLSEFMLFLFLQTFRSYAAPLNDDALENPEVAFIQNNLSTIIACIQDPWKHSAQQRTLDEKSGGRVDSVVLEKHEFDRLGLILVAADSGSDGCLSTLAPFWTVLGSSSATVAARTAAQMHCTRCLSLSLSHTHTHTHTLTPSLPLRWPSAPSPRGWVRGWPPSPRAPHTATAYPTSTSTTSPAAQWS